MTNVTQEQFELQMTMLYDRIVALEAENAAMKRDIEKIIGALEGTFPELEGIRHWIPE